jgi:hypothetical protein
LLQNIEQLRKLLNQCFDDEFNLRQNPTIAWLCFEIDRHLNNAEKGAQYLLSTELRDQRERVKAS